MSDALRWVVPLCAMLCVVAVSAIILSRWRDELNRAGESERDASLPVLMRLATPIAVVIEPLVAALLSDARRASTARHLEALAMLSAVSPVRWEALRVGVASLGAAIAGVAGSGSLMAVALVAACGYLWSGQWLRNRREAQQRRILRELPAWLDLMTVCIEAGATLTAGLRLIVAQAPEGPVRDYFERVLREIRGGRARAQAFSFVAEIYAVDSLSTLANALSHAESSGMGLGEVLRAQAQQRCAERFARAEKLAMQAPVKMLGPLILCIFPCTFIVVGVPIAVRLKEAFGA